MQYEQIKTLKAQVGFVLRTRPESRNSDTELNQILCGLFKDKSGKPYNPIRMATSIERCRRWFNQKGEYLPTSREVARQRKRNIDEWRVGMSYPTQEGNYNPPSIAEKPKTFQIPSESRRGVFYSVQDLGARMVCDCPSFQFSKTHTCKHVKRAVERVRLEHQVALFH